ncbi:hypothetical protein EYZ11_010909 [Aspergillus tanneri]|uniref:Zn(2)-C6 fungal-type domain-containing protein n=1 Tax=Aspergillus tanneri TaxID=1220188 RepID=A0A4S3J447_9EURO|nr:uncharacterized protein ATNIH1004_005477 [Aspergillus tanneri]KAA8646802.1 hypothetical protein ATNIH1004_005477 [Aspergillus tanneri]THC89646.1 hypothetical protein EYZ11_010909 [Aspergillus tanneri]
MAPPDVARQTRPVTIAPATHRSPWADHASDSNSTMPYTCQPCVRRKVKCDKALPACSSCSKGKLECIYQAPLPRSRKRKHSEDVHERLVRYERMLCANGLLSTVDNMPSKETPQTAQERASACVNESDTPGVGKLLAADGKSRYIDSTLWLDAGGVNMREMSEDEEVDHSAPAGISSVPMDPVSGAMLEISHSLVDYHPSYRDAMKQWDAYVQNVEPLCKILHVPTTAEMVNTLSQQPNMASKANECLVFSIYYFAVYSMTDEDCVCEFGQSQIALMGKYQYAFRQALVNVSWLRTTEIPVLQAYVLFLIAMRTQIDPHTFWIWTGVAIRIAQRMGLHRDGEGLGLPPFEIQMRRRLWWQLLPLESYAGQVSGTGISLPPNSWDTKQPLNLDDEQIYPGMTDQPEEQKGASQMIYCLAKTELSNFYTRMGVKIKDIGGAIQFRDSIDLEKRIDEVERSIETKYLRHCDIVNPVHLLTLGIVRSAANAVRLRSRMWRQINQSIDDTERRMLCVLAQKVLDTDTALYSNPHLRKFQWQIKTFFIWDVLIFVLNSLAKTGFFPPTELNSTWKKIADVYINHPEILQAKRALYTAVGKVTLKAWIANPPGNSIPEPAFITTLRSQHEVKFAERPEKADDIGSDESTDWVSPSGALFGDLSWGDLNLDSNYILGTADWLLWD